LGIVFSFGFWQKWLFGFGLYLVVFGLIMALFGQSSLMNFVFNNQIDSVFWGSRELSAAAAEFQVFVYGVLGATIVGWGVFLAFIAHYPFKAREPWAWNCVAIGVVMWFVVDTLVSIRFGVGFNVMVNIVFLSLALLPLLFTRRNFRKTDTT
jgi:hypothetical protein